MESLDGLLREKLAGDELQRGIWLWRVGMLEGRVDVVAVECGGRRSFFFLFLKKKFITHMGDAERGWLR